MQVGAVAACLAVVVLNLGLTPARGADPAKPDNRLFVVAYPVADLPVVWSEVGGKSEFDPSGLIEFIRGTVAPDSWDEGLINPVEKNGMLIVRQTAANHEKVANAIAALRPKQPKVLVEDKTVAVVYPIADLPVWAVGGKERHETTFEPSVLIALIKETVAPETWDREGYGVTAHSSTPALVVRQTQANHQKVHDLLTSLRPKHPGEQVEQIDDEEVVESARSSDK